MCPRLCEKKGAVRRQKDASRGQSISAGWVRSSSTGSVDELPWFTNAIPDPSLEREKVEREKRKKGRK